MNRLLGKKPVRLDTRTFRLAKYLKALGPQPESIGWTAKIAEWPMYLNDQLGDCVIATEGHLIELFTGNATGQTLMVSDWAIEQGYERVGGYVPGDPSTDNGCIMLNALNDWRQNGIGGHKIKAFAAIPHSPLSSQIRISTWLFGSAYIGLQLPLSAQGQKTWQVTKGPNSLAGSWGGHCVPIVGYSPHTLTCITWGQKLEMTWDFLFQYCDEAYAVLSQEWIESTGIAPSRFDLAQLEADLAKL